MWGGRVSSPPACVGGPEGGDLCSDALELSRVPFSGRILGSSPRGPFRPAVHTRCCPGLEQPLWRLPPRPQPPANLCPGSQAPSASPSPGPSPGAGPSLEAAPPALPPGCGWGLLSSSEHLWARGPPPSPTSFLL